MKTTIQINKPLWIISDIHGNLNQLLTLINNIKKEDPDPTLCFVGDLIDRGNDSIAVIDFVKNGNHFCVKGNHEEAMAREDMKDMWLYNDGYHTYKEYKNNPLIFADHKKWIDSLPTVIEFILPNEKPLFVSHSWFDIDNLENINFEDILYNKKKKAPKSENGINIFGHIVTPRDKSFFSDSHICIDTGGYKNEDTFKGVGFLTAIQYPSLNRVFSL